VAVLEIQQGGPKQGLGLGTGVSGGDHWHIPLKT